LVITVFWTLLIGLTFVLLYVRYRRRRNRQTDCRSMQSTSPTSIRLRVQNLAEIAWTTEQAFTHPHFLMSVEELAHFNTPEEVVKVLLRHAEQIAPGFAVPTMVPHVQVTSIPFAAGQFEVDEDGWVTIKLGSEFFQDKLAAHAILAHEVCHYILENSGIRQSDHLLNERDTDVCMFVCGFGALFLAGYRRKAAQRDYRPGHRLGYLSDADYRLAQREVMRLRSSTEIAPPSEVDSVKTRLLNLLYGDQATCQRYVEAERRRNPHQSEQQIYQAAIDRLERDRR
jgi:predicted SprT family Zn-dependent metalloprotease